MFTLSCCGCTIQPHDNLLARLGPRPISAFRSQLVVDMCLGGPESGEHFITMSNLQSNPLLAMRGLPPFSAIRADSVEPAIDTILAENREGLRRVLDSNETPSV